LIVSWRPDTGDRYTDTSHNDDWVQERFSTLTSVPKASTITYRGVTSRTGTVGAHRHVWET
jgi:hypothetical protein